VTALLILLPLLSAEKRPPQPSPLEAYVKEALGRPAAAARKPVSSGSLWSPAAPLGDLGRDLRASQVDDLVTILVSERATAIAKGTTKSARKTSANSAISAWAGTSAVQIPQLKNLAGFTGDSSLDGQATTSRESTLTATLAGRVTHVLPNGYLVVEAAKDTLVNSERQMITVRGIVRPADLAPGNFVRSDRLAQLEVKINGKGVVEDSIRRPNLIWRMILGLLPF
jgi:flagellar L-ring protein precursor FlgH